MIDLHSHILHDLDDGPPTLAGSLEMARTALADGITTMAATPHGRSVFSRRYSVELLQTRLSELRVALAAADLPLEVVPGTELFCAVDLPAQLKAGALLPYGTSRTVLVEFPGDVLSAAIEQMAFALQIAGYRVLIAHPERIKVVQRDPNVLIPLIERGVLMQLTADALTGKQGAHLRQIAETLLDRRMVHVIASDAHGAHLQRMPFMAPARRRAAEILDAAAAEMLVRTTPAALLRDAPVETPAPKRITPRRWWRYK
jgi:protein-tyrosine phosphatase